ncbi:hypothetical protein [Aminobacter sp. J44]|jgi:hypothetical protein|uniref:hypothetical protein n=1 Tax=Aminobacter sp. J44 TaxID=935262 RepID=UPI0011A930F4|nr:hypothetical protein [Aminobacter sp. J44]
MNALTPLIELAHQKSLDLFFRAGQGYLAGSPHQHGQQASGWGLSPVGVHSKARERIVCAVREMPPSAQVYARPGY